MPTPASTFAPERRETRRRPSTARDLSLETHAAVKFGIGAALGGAAVASGLPIAAISAFMLVAAILMGISLQVIAHEGSSSTPLLASDQAAWDTTLVILFVLVAVVMAVASEPIGLAISAVAAVALAILRLRTRYVV